MASAVALGVRVLSSALQTASTAGLTLSVFSTLFFDWLRDRACCGGGKRLLQPGDVLSTNIVTLVSSWFYALFHGRLYACAASVVAPALLAEPVGWFLAVSFLQRLMCAVVMPDVHAKTSALNHLLYYGCYFLGARGHHGRGEYAVLAAVSLAVSIISARATGAAARFRWRVQYRNGVLTELRDVHDYWARFQQICWWQQPESKVQYLHNRGAAVAAIIWQLYHWCSSSPSSSSLALFF